MFSGIREITWEEEDKVWKPPAEVCLLQINISPYANIALYSTNTRQREAYLYIHDQHRAASFEAPHFLE